MGSWCSKSDDEEPKKKGLSFIQFLILSSIASGTPFGAEYLVECVGVGYSLLGMVVLSLTFSWPSALISTELIALMPSNHGQIAWVYRAFGNFKGTIFGERISDYAGFMNGANVLLYYIFALPFMPIIFLAYLETMVGELSWGYGYLVELGVIVFGFVCAMLQVDIVGTTTNTLILISLSPLFIGFFWRLPDIEGSQWTEECSVYDWGFFFTQMTYLAAGYESLGALGGELNMPASKLPIAYSVSIIISCLMICCPIIAAATISYSECWDWYDGYFAVAYGEIWTPFYYMVLIAALNAMLAFMVLCFMLGARLVWAMAQDALLMLPDGTMVLDVEMTLMLKEDGGDNVAASGLDADAMAGQVTRIPVGILPKKMNDTWDRTGAPIWGNLLFLVTTAALCTFMSYEYAIYFTFYSYISTYLMVIASFMIMRIMEPDAPRWYKVPGGNATAWGITFLCFGLMLTFAIWAAVIYMYEAALVWFLCNVVFTIYYFAMRKCCKKGDDVEDEQREPLIEDPKTVNKAVVEEEQDDGVDENVAI